MKTSLLKKNKLSKKWNINLFNKKNLNLSTDILLKKSSFLFYKDILEEKQKLKYFFGFYKNKQFMTYYKKLKKTRKNYINNLIQLLYLKLDYVLSTSPFCVNVLEAKQLINHKKVKINNKFIKSYNYFIKKGDIIQINNNKVYNKIMSDNFYVDKEKKMILCLNNNINTEKLILRKELISLFK